MINVNATVDIQVAKQVSDQSIRAIEAAFRLYILPQGVFSVAIATVMFPLLARMAARKDHAGMGIAVTEGIRQIFFMLVPSAMFLALLATPVTRLINEHGEFTASDTSLTAGALLFFVLGLVFNGASLLLIRAFFSLQLPWTPTKIAAATVVLNIVLDLLLIIPLGTSGIPLATSIGSFVSFMALLLQLARHIPGIDFATIADGFVKTFVASMFLGAWAYGLWHALDGVFGRSLLGQVASLLGATVMGVFAYLAACYGMQLREMALLGMLRSKLR
jgi:putative peptidoglycan lipid II flippase